MNTDIRDARREQEKLDALHRLDEECVHLQRVGNYLQAFDRMERALVLRRHFFGADSPEVVHACKALAEMCNLLSMSFLQQDNYAVTLELLKKAEILAQHHPKEKATTLNNLACYYRRLGKLHTAMACLKKALAIEKKTLRDARNAADTHLNICAVLSQLNKHDQALEHAQAALVTLQEEFFRKSNATDTDGIAVMTATRNKDGQASQSSAQLERVSVMCIAYHNMGVEQEFLKDYQSCVLSYKKGVGLAEQYLGVDHAITTTIRNSYLAAKRTISTKVGSARHASKAASGKMNMALLSPRALTPPASLRLPSPIAKDKQQRPELPSPRSIVADALARGNRLPPLVPSPSVKKVSTGLSPEDPFFSPRFRFDSGTSATSLSALTDSSVTMPLMNETAEQPTTSNDAPNDVTDEHREDIAVHQERDILLTPEESSVIADAIEPEIPGEQQEFETAIQQERQDHLSEDASAAVISEEEHDRDEQPEAQMECDSAIGPSDAAAQLDAGEPASLNLPEPTEVAASQDATGLEHSGFSVMEQIDDDETLPDGDDGIALGAAHEEIEHVPVAAAIAAIEDPSWIGPDLTECEPSDYFVTATDAIASAVDGEDVGIEATEYTLQDSHGSIPIVSDPIVAASAECSIAQEAELQEVVCNNWAVVNDSSPSTEDFGLDALVQSEQPIEDFSSDTKTDIEAGAEDSHLIADVDLTWHDADAQHERSWPDAGEHEPCWLHEHEHTADTPNANMFENPASTNVPDTEVGDVDDNLAPVYVAVHHHDECSTPMADPDAEIDVKQSQ